MTTLKVVKSHYMYHLIYVIKMRGIDPGHQTIVFKANFYKGMKYWKGIQKFRAGSLKKVSEECDTNWAGYIMEREAGNE